ncbi:hypothetical protein O3M35_000551 [Rhynocoris fuscipes]|uniref:Uncharacterized protein n=1 Tax=Rhynocoris fuscipes TaxID=488301 RepID=A0AAW1DMY7_9HEMI
MTTLVTLVLLILFYIVITVTIECAVIGSNQERKLITSADNTGQIQGEIIVQSPPLTVKGPPKGFPLIRYRRDTIHLDNNNNITSVEQLPVTIENIDKKMNNLEKKAMMGLGYAPLVISNLKMLVMSAFMVNMMALNVAIFITLRNMVFGPRFGEHIRYYNFGYKQKKHKHHHHHSYKHS